MSVDINATDTEIECARACYGTDECEIDDGALASPAPGDAGRWVAAWVWVSDAMLEEHNETRA